MPDLLDAAADLAAREQALDIRRSFIVQAPAGSGKTDLLTRRILRLLAVVDQPEEILAITFTRAATAEMLSRVLRDLEAAAGRRRLSPDEASRLPLAQAALVNAERRGWNLLDHPQRLSIETIDSLCLRITRGQPLLAGLATGLQPTDTPDPLYTLAALRTLKHLGGSNPALDTALAYLLELRDNRLSDCQSLLAEMLASRDRWTHAFPLSGTMTEEDWEVARVKLEAPFHREVRRVLEEACPLFADQPAINRQIIEFAHYARANDNEKLDRLADVEAFSPDMSLEQWQCVCDLLMTGKEWRKTVNVRNGFPSNTREEKQRRADMIGLLRWLQHSPQLLSALRAIRNLPGTRYPDDQWATLRNVFTVLRQAVAELNVVFAETGSVDFTEIGLQAQHVLTTSPDRALALGGDLRHLLIDEFQDTSRRQHQLVASLLSAWEPGEGRTVFLVGDPMQSIYMFRQAEVELFTHVRRRGVAPLADPEAAGIPCDPVQLSVNFRSHHGLTEPINRIFEAICAAAPQPGAAAVPFARSTASQTAPPHPSLHIYPQILGSADRKPTRDEIRDARQREALEILRILERHLPAIEDASHTGREYRVAVLVRARSHLAQLLPLLRREQIPFRAVEIEHLSERQEMLDLLALTRALLHPMNRIAWLSVLRAPWCGLRLADLHRLTGSDDRDSRYLPVLHLIERSATLLSADGQRRLTRTAAILRRALDLRWRQSESPSFSSWIERTWRTLGGPACVDASGYENAQVFFSLLDAVTPDGLAPATPEFMAEFDRLFAQPDPAVSERCGIQLMTIHKAKGLGFEVVLLPGLHRSAAADDKPLIVSLERINPWQPGETEFLVAPIGSQGEHTDPLFKWVRKQRQIRLDEERKRLLYVACTRARNELHLFATASLKASGAVAPPGSDNLLAVAWPALCRNFDAATAQPVPPARVLAFPTPGVLAGIAATGDPQPSLTLRRLPLNIDLHPTAPNVTAADTLALRDPAPSNLSQPELSQPNLSQPEFSRPDGSRLRRIIGSVVHALLQRLGPELPHLAADNLRARAAALLRAAALTGEPLKSATGTVTKMLLSCAADPVCQWILAPHPDAQSEASWSGLLPGQSSRFQTLRADRVFRAGPAPGESGSEIFWIVDYKTGPANAGALLLTSERALYAPQLAAYARALRALHGADISLRLGLYYPAIATFDWWEEKRSEPEI
ncbi:MAG TPA: UvrD-helicase domain-containing protein [Acidobacteriaceae bacterium]|nr:UvrD-helicase domain-containing protein [Acidobacteriaceae bacterium]